MEQKDKQLLLKDLSARLSYKVMCFVEGKDKVYKLKGIIKHRGLWWFEFDGFRSIEAKPYLRPMSSMTEEECLELSKLKPIYDEVAAWKYIKTPVPLAIANIKQFDFFHSHHLDWIDLIPKGLALEAPKDMYKEE